MQPLTDPVYRNLTAGQVTSLITGPNVTVSSGLELLDGNDTVISDISDDLVSGTISHNNTATIHGTCSLSLSHHLTWGVQRVRPYMTLTDPDTAVNARWNLGVYVLATPARPVGEIPETYQVTGSDKLYLLSGPVGDSYSVGSGANVLSAVTTAIETATGVPSSEIVLDGTQSAATLPNAMTWPLSSSKIYTWLDVVNGLLGTVGYQPVWCDWNGLYRSGPLQDPTVRSSEFTFDADDVTQAIVAESRTVTADLWQAPNWWRFIAQNWASTPTEGNGQYTVQNVSDGPSSQTAVDRTVRKVVYLNAASQAALQTAGDQQVAVDKNVVTTITVGLAPMPAQWHLDVATYIDSAIGSQMKVATASWTLDLTGADGQTVWDVVA